MRLPPSVSSIGQRWGVISPLYVGTQTLQIHLPDAWRLKHASLMASGGQTTEIHGENRVNKVARHFEFVEVENVVGILCPW